MSTHKSKLAAGEAAEKGGRGLQSRGLQRVRHDRAHTEDKSPFVNSNTA